MFLHLYQFLKIKSKSFAEDIEDMVGMPSAYPTYESLQSFCSATETLEGFFIWWGFLISFFAPEKVISVLIKSNGSLNLGLSKFLRFRQLKTGDADKWLFV